MKDMTVIEVGSFLNRIDAEMAQGILEIEHIPSVVSADDEDGIRPDVVLVVRLLVRGEDAARARQILSEME